MASASAEKGLDAEEDQASKRKEDGDKRVELLNEDDDLTEAFTRALIRTFLRFSEHARQAVKDGKGKGKEEGDDGTYSQAFGRCSLKESELDQFAKTVNGGGKVMTADEKAELREYFDTDDEGNLTFNGFCEMYQLQTSSQEDETWKDLKALGFDEKLAFSSEENADV